MWDRLMSYENGFVIALVFMDDSVEQRKILFTAFKY